MNKLGFDFPKEIRKTRLFNVEQNWYLPFLAEKKGLKLESIKTSNFGQYEMAVNYLTSVLEESKAIEKVAIYNIDHMCQLRFTGKDVVELLNRALPADFTSMKIGTCKYTLLLNDNGGVQDDLIAMRIAENEFILVINAGHDITDEIEVNGEKVKLIADIDRIMSVKKDDEEVFAEDISDSLVKIDVQGPYSYKLLSKLYGVEVLKNRNKPAKNMSYFTFNDVMIDGHRYFFSRTGYTSRWGWEVYVPAAVAEEQFKRIVTEAVELGGLLVGLGGRDENRTSAGNFGLPLMGSDYRPNWNPVNAPLFNAAVDMNKDSFVGKEALKTVIDNGCNKRMFIIISEGIVVDRLVYINGKKAGLCTSSINSPNVSQEKREFLNSKRASVNGENGVAAIGLVWLDDNPFEVDAEGKDITEKDGNPIRIQCEFFRTDKDGNPKGRAVTGYISPDGICPATAPKPLKKIAKL